MSLLSKFKNNQKRKNEKTLPIKRSEDNILEISSKDKLKSLQKELETKQEELELRGKIIEDIHKQLQNNLAQLIEKIDYANNLEEEFEQTKTLLRTKDQDISNLKEELFDRKNNPDYINTLLVKLYDELKHNKQDQLQKQQRINELQEEFQNKEKELESLYSDMESRNIILQDVTQQLIDNQMNLMEKHANTDIIKNELEQNLANLNLKEEKIHSLQKELEERQNDLEIMKSDLDIRNKIINEIKNQMIENQQKFTESNLLFNDLVEEHKLKNKNIEQLKNELQEKEKHIEYRNNLISRQQDEINHLSFDVEAIKQDIDFKRENILELKSELENRKNDLETMKGDIDLRNKIINEIKNQMIENQQKFTEKNILLNELGDIKLKINENKSALEVVEGELAKRKSELQGIAPIQQETTEPMIDDLTTSDEIEKNIDVLDESIKTKKLDFQAELNED